MKKDRGEKKLKTKKLMHVVRVKACNPNLLQKKNNRANKSTLKKNVVVVTVQGGNNQTTVTKSINIIKLFYFSLIISIRQ